MIINLAQDNILIILGAAFNRHVGTRSYWEGDIAGSHQIVCIRFGIFFLHFGGNICLSF